MNEQFRQGDILLVRVHPLPLAMLVAKPAKDGKVILAYGERTGHAHALSARFAKALESHNDRTYIKVRRGAVLYHEEHAPIPLPEGCYEVIQQKEYVVPRAPERELTYQDYDAMAMD